MNESDNFPAIRAGDWIRFGNHWLTVSRVYEPGRVRCLHAPDGNAYLRDFIFRNGWWDFENPSPDGSYLPTHKRKHQGEILSKGPPYQLVTGESRIQYVYQTASVWQPHDWPNPSNPPVQSGNSNDSA